MVGTWFSLADGGLQSSFAKEDLRPGQALEMRAKLAPAMPPMIEAPPAAAAGYVYGAYAITDDRKWARGALPYLAAWPKPPGGRRAWAAHLTGPEGITPARLLSVIAANPRTPEMPDGKEPVIFTEVRLRVPPGCEAEVARGLVSLRHPRCFASGSRDGMQTFDWLRPYRVARRSRSGGPGMRQGMGLIAIGDGRARVEAMTLTRAAILLHALLSVCPPTGVSVEATEWHGPDEAIAPPR